MKAGKPSEAVLSRSVLKQLNKDNGAVNSRMKQLDYGSFELGEKRVVMSTQAVAYPAITPGKLAVHSALNNIFCSGAKAKGVMLTILFPTEGAEQDLRAIVKDAEAACVEQEISICGGHTEILSGIKEPVVIVTAVGAVAKNALVLSDGAKPGMDLVVTKHIGLGGTAILANIREEQLLKRYSAPFIDKAKAFEKEVSVQKEAGIALKHKVAAMHDVSLGGIYGALWELADRANIGLTVDLKAIPIRQETVEISELLDINPYKLFGAGSLLIATDKGEELVEKLAKAGVGAAVIGRCTDTKDRILFTGEEQRFLETTQSDELYKFRK